ncbi:MAG: polysaccharide deacetylase family protein [Bacteroidales bacterium]|nr:polysaccharide deacetylase family protein [Bacteroidales bacterium]
MSLTRKIKSKLYYQYANLLDGRSDFILPTSLENRKNLFVYFDYEREFGGHETSIQDTDVEEILDTLNGYGIQTTWFTVGKIFEAYPESIRAILSRGHEVGSHTYGHIAPYKHAAGVMQEDFENFEKVTEGFSKVKGFHSPNGLWSISMLRQLGKFDYAYDVLRVPGKGIAKPYSVKSDGGKRIVRLQTIGDDWQMYIKKRKAGEVFDYYKGLTGKMRNGDVAGVGFHPWVLHAEPEIMEGFKMFLDYLSRSDEFNIQTALNFVTSYAKPRSG